MTETEHLLVCLSEECAEVQQAIAKALRFGLDDSSPTGLLPCNREYIRREMDDVFGVFELLQDRGIVKPHAALSDAFGAIAAKKAKVLRFMEHAKSKGALTPNTEVKGDNT